MSPIQPLRNRYHHPYVWHVKIPTRIQFWVARKSAKSETETGLSFHSQYEALSWTQLYKVAWTPSDQLPQKLSYESKWKLKIQFKNVYFPSFTWSLAKVSGLFLCPNSKWAEFPMCLSSELELAPLQTSSLHDKSVRLSSCIPPTQHTLQWVSHTKRVM